MKVIRHLVSRLDWLGDHLTWVWSHILFAVNELKLRTVYPMCPEEQMRRLVVRRAELLEAMR